MKKIIVVLLFLSNIVFGQSKYEKDFNEFWTVLNENYAYFQKQNINWEIVKEIYEPKSKLVTNDQEFIQLLETVLNELHNGHSTLNTNLKSSNKLIPTGLDVYVEKINNKFIITDLRKDYGAEKCGLKVGMEIIKFNDTEITEQLKQFLPKFSKEHDAKMVQFAISMLFAGTHNKERKITTIETGNFKEYYPDSNKIENITKLIEYKILENNIGYIKINNSLGNNILIFDFDKAIDSLMNTNSIILDLTETPSGGNSTVAKSIMGRFISKKLPYQQHEYDELAYETKSSWVEYVSPRKTQYKAQVVIMVGHWTGSMSEGIAIGFDAMKRATVIGTKMAGLIGAINGFTLSETKIGFQFPTERLYHINGIAREDYEPKILTKNSNETWKKTREKLMPN